MSDQEKAYVFDTEDKIIMPAAARFSYSQCPLDSAHEHYPPRLASAHMYMYRAGCMAEFIQRSIYTIYIYIELLPIARFIVMSSVDTASY